MPTTVINPMWANEMKLTVQGISTLVDRFNLLAKDPSMVGWESSIPAQYKPQIDALKTALFSLNASITPELKKLLGIV